MLQLLLLIIGGMKDQRLSPGNTSIPATCFVVGPVAGVVVVEVVDSTWSWILCSTSKPCHCPNDPVLFLVHLLSRLESSFELLYEHDKERRSPPLMMAAPLKRLSGPTKRGEATYSSSNSLRVPNKGCYSWVSS